MVPRLDLNTGTLLGRKQWREAARLAAKHKTRFKGNHLGPSRTPTQRSLLG
jgi:hypothetical protein